MAKQKEFEMTKVKSARTPAQKFGTGVLAVVINAVLWLFSLSCIFPLVWMFYSSLKKKREFNADIIGLPHNPSFENYIKVLTNKDYHLGSVRDDYALHRRILYVVVRYPCIAVYSTHTHEELVHMELGKVLYGVGARYRALMGAQVSAWHYDFDRIRIQKAFHDREAVGDDRNWPVLKQLHELKAGRTAVHCYYGIVLHKLVRYLG